MCMLRKASSGRSKVSVEIDVLPTDYTLNRRKFRSQTSDNMDKWKSRGGKSQRREEQKREDQRREKVKKKEDAGARKGRNVANHCDILQNLWLRRVEK